MAFVATTLTVAMLMGVGVVVVILVNPTPSIHVSRRMVRLRGRTVPFSAIDSARAPMAGQSVDVTEVSTLWFGRSGRPLVPVVLRHRGETSLTPDQMIALVAMIEGSGIRFPQSSFDPEGRFSKYNYPEHLDKAHALALIVDEPPKSG